MNCLFLHFFSERNVFFRMCVCHVQRQRKKVEFRRVWWIWILLADYRKEPRSIFSRKYSGGSLMLWKNISFNGQTLLAFITGCGCQNSENCQEHLINHFLPVRKIIDGKDWIIEHDNASTNFTNSPLQWPRSNIVYVLNWQHLFLI